MASVLDAQLSIPYAVAVALSDGNVGMSQFDADRWLDPALCSLARRVKVVPSKEHDDLYPWSATRHGHDRGHRRPGRVLAESDAAR